MLPVAIVLQGTRLVGADRPDARPPDSEPSRLDKLPNIKSPTLGGKQLWADQIHFRKWRIQRNVVTGHHRLLDGKDFRRAFGSFRHCQSKLEEFQRKRGLTPLTGKAVIVLHGLCRTRSAMKGICRHLEEKGNYHVYNVSYPTTRGDVATHAKSLARIIENLKGVEQIHFVGHSLGNLVVRHYLADTTDDATGRRPDPRIGRIVMLAPPNNGARLAERVGRNKAFELIVGASGTQIASKWKELEKHLATPRCQFGIIAGGGGKQRGRNPIIHGDDDLVVSVEETRLAGARDFIVLPVFHTFMMDDDKVRECTLRFLNHGYFLSEAQRQPL